MVMKENIFDVLMYLFENYLGDEFDALPDSDVIRTELYEAGFEHAEVSRAFDWLESLSIRKTIQPTVTTTFRIFSDQEKLLLDLECRDFIMFLEQAGILTPENREIVIDRIIALENEEISLEKIKWIILMVLLSQPDDEVAFSRMEDIVYDNIPLSFH
jgi:Smg protein